MRVPGQRRFFRWPGARQRADQELRDELDFHRDQIIAELIHSGMSADLARTEADHRLGDLNHIEKQVTRSSTLEAFQNWLADLTMDLRFAFRLMLKTPSFPLIAVLTLGLGIGANLAVFSVFNTVVLKALPYPESDQLVAVWPSKNFSIQMAEEYSQQIGGLSSMAAYQGTSYKLTLNNQVTPTQGAQVSASYFKTLGVAPALGRDFSPQDALAGGPRVLIISHQFWRDALGLDPQVLQRVVQINDVAHQVIGVLPEGHRSLHRGWQHWAPYQIEVGSHDYEDNLFLNAIGRLSPGTEVQQVEASLRTYLQSQQQDPANELGENEVRTATVTPLRDQILGNSKKTLAAILIAAALVLLVAVANIANLSLARLLTRNKEIAIRRAIGCDNLRLGRQMLTEQLTIGILASLVGIAVALSMTSYFADHLSNSFGQFRQVSLSGREILFIVALTLGVSISLGLLALLAARRIETVETLRGQRSSTGRRHNRLNLIMLIAQTAFSVLLVVMAGLMVKSLVRLSLVDPGFDIADRVHVQIQIPGSVGDDQGQGEQFIQTVLEASSNLPGINAAEITNHLPLTSGNVGVYFTTPGFEIPAGERAPVANVRVVSPGYFQAMGIQLLDGRGFAATDNFNAPPVALVNPALLRQLQKEKGLNLPLVWTTGEAWVEVIGVVADVRQHQLSLESRPEIYLPFTQGLWERRMDMVVHSSLPLETLSPALRSAISSVDPSTLISAITPLDQVLAKSIQIRSFMATLFSTFALIALVLAVTGVYALTSQALARSQFELGLRMAMGATNGQLIIRNVRLGLLPALVGCAAGLVASLFSVSLVEHVLFKVSGQDLSILILASAVFLVAASLAVALPSARIPRISPQRLLLQQ